MPIMKSTHKKEIPDKFPLFNDWPEYKLEFMSKLSSIIPENAEEIVNETKNEKVEEATYNFVIATDTVYKYNESGMCYICNCRLPIEYDVEIDSWIYPDCELDNEKYVIHEICMEYK